MKEVFQKLRTSLLPVSPEGLIRSFGWTNQQTSEQQDISEFWRVLSHNLAKRPNLESLDDIFTGSFIWKYGVARREERFWGTCI